MEKKSNYQEGNWLENIPMTRLSLGGCVEIMMEG
jgi:hypothetical protein